MNFVVVDTEGKPELSELAIIDSHGVVIYEGLSNEHPRISPKFPNLKSLKTLLTEFLTIVQGKTIICHYAEHDIDVLKYSFRKVGLTCPNLQFECTYNLAKSYWQGLESYSLDYLSKYLNLQANNQYFNSGMAHTARYDAEFTYQLYKKIMLENLKYQANPFSSSRVDTPFQNHPDYFDTYYREFLILTRGLEDVKQDINYQSKGIVVIGEPGSGKTHLMMRLAQNRLPSNRLLFIRQPNNAQAILYHIYSRILESLVEKVSHLSQLEYLIINSFRTIINLGNISVPQKYQEFVNSLNNLSADNINILLGDNTQIKRDAWQYIEKIINDWWINNYAAGRYALSIIKGMVKYCSYTDPVRKNITTRWLAGNTLTDEEAEKIGLPNWGEEVSQEAFSLEVISVLGKLSILDEPLIIIFDQLEALGLPHNKEILLNFGEAVKEIFTHVPNSLIILNLFPDRWEQFQTIFDNSIIGRISQYQVYLRQPTESEIKAILQIKLQSTSITLEQLFSPEELDDILGHKPIRAALNRAADYYNYKVHGIPLRIEKKVIHEPDKDEKIEQQLRILQHQQQVSIEVLMQVIQSIQQPSSIDVSNLHQKLLDLLVGEGIEPILENPVIEYLTQHKNELEQKYSNSAIITDSDDIGKLKTIADAFNKIKPVKLTQYRLGKKQLPEHIVIENGVRNYVIGFLQINGNSFTSRIGNFNELVNIYPQSKFELFRDERLPEITGKVGKEPEMLNADTKLYIDSYTNSKKPKLVNMTSSPQTNEHN